MKCILIYLFYRSMNRIVRLKIKKNLIEKCVQIRSEFRKHFQHRNAFVKIEFCTCRFSISVANAFKQIEMTIEKTRMKTKLKMINSIFSIG